MRLLFLVSATWLLLLPCSCNDGCGGTTGTDADADADRDGEGDVEPDGDADSDVDIDGQGLRRAAVGRITGSDRPTLSRRSLLDGEGEGAAVADEGASVEDLAGLDDCRMSTRVTRIVVDDDEFAVSGRFPAAT